MSDPEMGIMVSLMSSEQQRATSVPYVLDGVGRLKEEIVRAGALPPVVRAHPVNLHGQRGERGEKQSEGEDKGGGAREK